jgi:hypothetical protein
MNQSLCRIALVFSFLGEIMNQWANMFILFQRIIVFLLKKKIDRKKFWVQMGSNEPKLILTH